MYFDLGNVQGYPRTRLVLCKFTDREIGKPKTAATVSLRLEQDRDLIWNLGNAAYRRGSCVARLFNDVYVFLLNKEELKSSLRGAETRLERWLSG